MLLLYSMCAPGPLPSTGIRNAPLRSIENEGVTLVFSHFTSDPNNIQQDALSFHQANNAIFKDRVIIPFQFPTTVPDESAVHDFLNKHAAEYRAELHRLHDFVQMDATVSEQREQSVEASSGTDYLKHRQSELHATKSLLAEIQSAGAAQDWKQSRRPNTIKLSALVKRGDEAAFRQQLASTKARITGPWPPAAFVNCYPEAE
jgi:hypothetical protein